MLTCTVYTGSCHVSARGESKKKKRAKERRAKRGPNTACPVDTLPHCADDTAIGNCAHSSVGDLKIRCSGKAEMRYASQYFQGAKIKHTQESPSHMHRVCSTHRYTTHC